MKSNTMWQSKLTKMVCKQNVAGFGTIRDAIVVALFGDEISNGQRPCSTLPTASISIQFLYLNYSTFITNNEIKEHAVEKRSLTFKI